VGLNDVIVGPATPVTLKLLLLVALATAVVTRIRPFEAPAEPWR